MKIYGFLACLLVLVPIVAGADETLSVEYALHETYASCYGIDEELDDLKKMAGINTVVTGVGTGLAAGATVVGIKKASVDKQVVRLDKLRKSLEGMQGVPALDNQRLREFESAVDIYVPSGPDDEEEVQATYDDDIAKLEQQSKKLGHWRTGLMGGATATGVAGAIIAGNNKTDETLREHVERCIKSIENLKNVYMIAKVSGEATFDAREVINACESFKYVDLSKIDKRATGAMVSSIVTATVGGTGTVVSALANTDKVRNDNTDEGQRKEKNLNTAANVLAAGTTASSAVATVFNASQIAVVKQIIKVAENCSAAL